MQINKTFGHTECPRITCLFINELHRMDIIASLLNVSVHNYIGIPLVARIFNKIGLSVAPGILSPLDE